MKTIQLLKILSVAAVLVLISFSKAGAVSVIGPEGLVYGAAGWYAPISEADIWAILALGLGLVGLRLRSKKNTTLLG